MYLGWIELKQVFKETLQDGALSPSDDHGMVGNQNSKIIPTRRWYGNNSSKLFEAIKNDGLTLL